MQIYIVFLIIVLYLISGLALGIIGLSVDGCISVIHELAADSPIIFKKIHMSDRTMILSIKCMIIIGIMLLWMPFILIIGHEKIKKIWR